MSENQNKRRTVKVPAAETAKEPEEDLAGDVTEKENTLPPGAEDLVEGGGKVRTRKDADKEAAEEIAKSKDKKAKAKVVPTDDYVRDKKGNIRLDEDKDKMRYAPGFHKSVGFVSENGVLFPVGFEFPGGFVGSFGNVILNRCPKCKHHQSIDAARSGRCEAQDCGYNAFEDLEEVSL